MRRLIDNSNDPPKKQPHIGRYGHLRKAYIESYSSTYKGSSS